MIEFMCPKNQWRN